MRSKESEYTSALLSKLRIAITTFEFEQIVIQAHEEVVSITMQAQIDPSQYSIWDSTICTKTQKDESF